MKYIKWQRRHLLLLSMVRGATPCCRTTSRHKRHWRS